MSVHIPPCEAAGDDAELKLLPMRAWAKDGRIVSLCLRPDFHITAGWMQKS